LISWASQAPCASGVVSSTGILSCSLHSQVGYCEDIKIASGFFSNPSASLATGQMQVKYLRAHVRVCMLAVHD